MTAHLPETLHCTVEDGIALLRLSRPEKRNALDDASIRGLARFFDDPPEAARAVFVLFLVVYF
jgi:enoyl-CoA hydratase/carnithine racemase